MYSHKPGELICKKISYYLISFEYRTRCGEQLADVSYFIRDLFKWTAVQTVQTVYLSNSLNINNFTI